MLQNQDLEFGAGRAREVSSVAPVAGAFESHAFLCCFRKVIQVFSTAEGLLTQDDRVTAHGLQEVFATNVFGHFVLVKCPQASLSTGS